MRYGNTSQQKAITSAAQSTTDIAHALSTSLRGDHGVTSRRSRRRFSSPETLRRLPQTVRG